MRSRVRKRDGRWEVWTWGAAQMTPWRDAHYPTYWQAMLHVTGQLPYRDETPWSPSLRPMWIWEK